MIFFYFFKCTSFFLNRIQFNFRNERMRPHNLLIFFFLVSLPMPVSGGDCDGKGPCYIHTWATWGPCIGTCGFYFQERSRSLCCPFTVQPRTIENCVHYCNITEGVNERRYCILCGNGTIDYSTMDCLCKPYYKGKCCQGIGAFAYYTF